MNDSYANDLLKNAVSSGDISIEIDKDSLDIANTNLLEDIGSSPVQGPGQRQSTNIETSTRSDRNVIERKTIISINSANREIYYSSIHPRNNFGFYIRENAEGLPVVITPTLLNNENANNPISCPYYYLPNGDIAKKEYKYETPSNYVIPLPKTYINVKSIRLLSAEIPTYIYNIDEFNNTLFLDLYKNGVKVVFDNGYNFLTIILPVGRYDIIDTITLITTSLSSASLLQFLILYNKNNGIIEISIVDAGYTFHLKFISNVAPRDKFSAENNYENALWKMLGFKSSYEINTDGSDKYTEKLTNRNYYIPARPYFIPNMFPSKYIYLVLNNCNNVIEAAHTTPFYYFSKIFINEDYRSKFISSPMIYTTTLDKLSELSVKFITLDNQYVNFNGLDHSFTIEIVEYLDELDYINMNTRRGISDKKWYPDIIKSN